MIVRASQSALAQARGAASAQARAYSQAVPGIGMPAVPSAIINRSAQEQALSLDALFGSITANAGPRRDRQKTYPGTGLNPAMLAGILRQADTGIVDRWQELIQQATQRDARARNADRGRRVAIVGRPYSIRPRDGSPEAAAMAALVEEGLDGMSGWKRGMRYLLGASGAGFASCEPIFRWRKARIPWREEGGKATVVTVEVKAIEELRRVHGKHFQFNTDQTSDTPIQGLPRVLQLEGQTPLLNVSAGAIYLPRHKFIFHVSSEGDGRIEERGWWRTAIWLHMLKQKAISSWAEFINRFGVPNVRGSVPYNIWADKKRSTMYQRFLEYFGENVATLFPDDLKVTTDAYQPGGTSKDAFASFIGWLDTQITILIQAEHLTTEIGDSGSYNAASEQANEKRAVVADDAEALAETLRDQLFWSLIELNAEILAGALNVSPLALLRARPYIVFRLDNQVSRKERLQEMSLAVNELGMDITERQAREEGDFDPPTPGEKVLPGKKQQLFPGGALVPSGGPPVRNPGQEEAAEDAAVKPADEA